MNLSRNQRTSEGRDEFNQIFGICITLTNYFLSFNVSLVNRLGIWFYTAIRCVYYVFLNVCWYVEVSYGVFCFAMEFRTINFILLKRAVKLKYFEG